MPIYEYICRKYQTQFELRRSFSDSDQPARCPACNSSAQKLFSSFACKMGSNIQPTEKPFRKTTAKGPESSAPGVMITPPPNRVELLPPPPKKTTRARQQKK
jgi:putative FmdB family regulatory protein